MKKLLASTRSTHSAIYVRKEAATLYWIIATQDHSLFSNA